MMTGSTRPPLADMRVGDLMTHGAIRTLPAQMTVIEAIEIMRRYGHEGYPVVDGPRVLGVLTQGVLGRAAHHQLSRTHVSDLVIGTALTIGREAPVSEARRIMLSQGVGQLPVVEGGRLIGIITRTDLLRAWGREDEPTRVEVTQELRAVLDPRARRAIDAIAEMARSRGDGIYLVGGLPRDLVLHRIGDTQPLADLDIVVEGDAAELALAVAAAAGGTVRSHERFGTATWETEAGDLAIDLVSARSEFYAAPAVLPTVEPGSLHSDLVRRDFTINTLAIDLQPGAFGRLIDRLGGLRDLSAGRIRVLHPLSFVEDPTRILRAVRFEQRFGFHIEDGTRALALRAGPWLTRTTGARIQAELRKSMLEREPGAVLRRLGELGVLEAIAPGLKPLAVDGLGELPERLEHWLAHCELEPSAAPPQELARWRLLAWLASEGPAGERAGLRLDLAGRDLDLVRSAAKLRGEAERLAAPELAPSQLCQHLDGYKLEAICLVWLLAEEAPFRAALWRYASRLQGIVADIDGEDLAALGLAPGPVYGRVLQAVRDARLDGAVASREEALALARELVARLD